MVWIKICGITNTSDAEMAVRCGADALGFVFSTDSPRRIDLETASGIISHLRDIAAGSGTGTAGSPAGRVKAAAIVGVFVNEDMEKIRSISGQLKLDYVQLSGDEDSDHIKTLKEMMPVIKVIKAIRIRKNPEDYLKHLEAAIRGFEATADHILMDSYHPSKYGGTGKTFDRDTARRFGALPGFILSGGLDHLNIAEAIRSIGPFGIDASSRLEASPGRKDHRLVKSFIEAARRAAGVEHG